MFTSKFLPTGRMVTTEYTSVPDKVTFNIQSVNLEEAAYFPFIFIYTKFYNDIFSCSRIHLFDCLFTHMHFRSRKYIRVREKAVKDLLLPNNFPVLCGTLI